MNNILDLQKIADKLDFDLEDVEMLLEVFLESTQESMQSLRIAIDENNLDEIFSSAHGIKGSSANLTLLNISAIAGEIEHAARDKEDINFNEKFIELKTLLDTIKV